MFAKVESQSNGIDLIKIDNEETKIVFTNYGARIVSWKFDDNNIVLGNVVEVMNFIRKIHSTSVQLLADMVEELPMQPLNWMVRLIT